MANQWLRLWHDMPDDPKWRVIAKVSGQPLHLVIALYVTLLVDASKNGMSRGVTKCHDENLAVTLDCDMSQIVEIKAAMQGRVLEGNYISGWETRQPKREDCGDSETGAKSAAARKRDERARKKIISSSDDVTQCHEMSRNVTTDKDKEEDKEKTIRDTNVSLVIGDADHGKEAVEQEEKIPACPHQKILELYRHHLPELPYPAIWEGQRQKNLAARWRWVLTAKRKDGTKRAETAQDAIDYFSRFFAHVAKSDFLTGRNGGWGNCDLGWLVKAENFSKVISGNYDNKD